MKFAVTGAGGQLGLELIRIAENSGIELQGFTREQLDITSAEQIEAALVEYQPDILINAAAYTNVDAAESNHERAYAVNATAAGLLADWCRGSKTILVHISTDYVFDGRKSTDYLESDAVSPLNVYGTTKAQGEALVRKNLPRHLILRTSWLYSPHGKNFVKTIIGLAAKNDVLRVVADQYGSPTSATVLAEAIFNMTAQLSAFSRSPWGTYHYCCRGIVSWHDLAAEILRLMSPRPDGRAVRTKPIPTNDYPTAATRPKRSGLDCHLFQDRFQHRCPAWDKALEPVVKQLTQSS